MGLILANQISKFVIDQVMFEHQVFTVKCIKLSINLSKKLVKYICVITH